MVSHLPIPPKLQAALDRGTEAAFGVFLTLLSQRPGDPAFPAWLEQAWRNFPSGDGAEGLRAAVDAAGGDRLSAMLLLARVVAGAGNAPRGLDIARAAQARAPAEAAPAFLLCALMLRRGDPEAQAQLQHCLAHFPQPSQGWSDLGAQLLALGKKPAALVCFQRGEPGPASAMRRGLLAKELGQRAAARAGFEEAVALSPEMPRAWFLLGTCAQDDRDFAAAAKAYATVLALDPTLAEAAVNLGTVLQETGDLEGARAAYRRAVSTRRDTFGRVAQALSTSPKGELWLDLEALRRSLTG